MLKAPTSDARMKHLAHGYEIGSPAQSLLSLSKHKANITELHPKVRPTCIDLKRVIHELERSAPL